MTPAAFFLLLPTLASPGTSRAPGVEPTGEALVAVYRDGAVTAADVASWSRFVELDAGSPSRLALAAKVEEIVVLRTLAHRFESRPAAGAEADRQRRELEARLAESALRRHLLAQAEPPEAELERLYEAARPTLAQPKRWRLEDIFKAFPPGADEAAKDAARQALATVRQRLAAGADFAELARAESESSTRLRGGAMGFVTLERLTPALRETVAGMHAGDISPVVELARGVTLLRCVQVIEAHTPSFEEARVDLATEPRNRRFQALWEEAAKRGGPAAEAERLGLTRTPDHQLLLGWKRLELAAQAAANEAGEALITEPSEEELRAAFDAQREGWSEPRSWQLRRLRVLIRQDLPASFYDRVRGFGRELAAGRGTLEAAAAALAPHAEIDDLGWLTDDEVWALGLNVDAAVHALEPSGFTTAVQEARSLQILQLVARKEERRLSFAEARPQVRASLVGRRRREAGARLRKQILDEQAIQMKTNA